MKNNKTFLYVGPYDVPQEEDFSAYNAEGEAIEISGFDVIFVDGKYEVEIEAEWPEQYTISSFYKEKIEVAL